MMQILQEKMSLNSSQDKNLILSHSRNYKMDRWITWQEKPTHIMRLVCCLILLACTTVQGQDIHLSQIHASPTFLNPAMTGLYDGDFRLIANYKQQWRNTTANYRTLALGFDSKISDLDNQGFLAVGLNLFSDKAGDLDFSTTSAMLTFSAAKSLDRRGKHMIMMAVQGGLIRNSLDYTMLNVFDPEPSIVAGSTSQVNVMDASAGIAWYSRFDNHLVYGGISASHLGQPDMAMIGRGLNYEEKLQRKFIFHGGGEFKLNNKYTLMPSFITMEQLPHREWLFGSFIRYDHSEYKRDKGSSFYLGAWYRYFLRTDIKSSSDGLVLSARLDQNKLTYAFSYDLNFSSLSRATKGIGGPELSIIYVGRWNGTSKGNSKSKIDCPKF
ncbi:MAG: type IX secretion system PorP/SprF family membrane protein [Limisphaerales bacterium]|jgi:type IX secretion system PorP/SprF family membrane protein